MKKLLYLSMFLWLVLTGCTQEKKEFTVLQWNIWQEGTMVPGGYEAIVDEIIRLRPDFVTLSEVRNYNNTNFTARLTRSLKEKGETYYSFYTYDTGLLSRYPITDSLTVFPENGDHGSIYRLTTDMNGKKMAVIPLIWIIWMMHIIMYVDMTVLLGKKFLFPLQLKKFWKEMSRHNVMMPSRCLSSRQRKTGKPDIPLFWVVISMNPRTRIGQKKPRTFTTTTD